jgi:hypothetical protein
MEYMSILLISSSMQLCMCLGKPATPSSPAFQQKQKCMMKRVWSWKRGMQSISGAEISKACKCAKRKI